jgi:hypothetical protein
MAKAKDPSRDSFFKRDGVRKGGFDAGTPIRAVVLDIEEFRMTFVR